MPEIIPVDKKGLLKKSQRIEIDIQGDTYIFEFYYIPQQNIFTFDLYKNDEPILYGRKIVYAQDILSSLFLDFKIIPVAYDDSIREITKDNFLNDVKLFLVES